MIITSPKYTAASARSLRIHSPAKCFWALDPTNAFQQRYHLPNGGRLGLIKKDMGIRETRRRGLDEDNTNYGHSLSLTERFATHTDFTDLREHFTALGAERSETTPCSGAGYYATRLDFTILQSLAFFLVHGFELHLDPDFLEELPGHWEGALNHLQQWLSQNVIGWDENLKTLAEGGPDQLLLN